MQDGTSAPDDRGQPAGKISRRAMLRAAVGGVTASAAAGMLASCSSAEPTGTVERPAKLNFMHFFTGVLWTGAFQHLTKRFHEENPTITWAGTAVPYAELSQKLLTAAAGGQPPDGVSVGTTAFQDLAYRNLFAELDSYASKDKVDLSDIYKARADTCRLNGKLYGLPIDMGTSAVYYNKEMFDAAGLDYPDPGWTHDDMLDTAKRLTIDAKGRHPDDAGFDEKNIKQWGLTFPSGSYRFWNLYHGLNGAVFFDDKLTKTQFDTQAGVESMRWWSDIHLKHHAGPSPAQTAALSQNGSVIPFVSGAWAMEYSWIGLNAYLNEEGAKVTDWDVVNLPETPTSVQEVGGQSFTVLNGAKQPEAAWKWAKFMTGDEAQKFLAVNGVWFPSKRSIAKQYGQPKSGKPEHFYEAFYDQVDKHGFSPTWFVPGYTEWEQTIDSNLENLWSGRQTPERVAEAIKKGVDPKMKGWRDRVPS